MGRGTACKCAAGDLKRCDRTEEGSNAPPREARSVMLHTAQAACPTLASLRDKLKRDPCEHRWLEQCHARVCDPAV